MTKWIANTFGDKPPDLIIEPKIDGASLTILYENGRMQYAATRGDGFIGQDVTHTIRYIHTIPHKITVKDQIEIRGEIYLPKNNTFSKEDEPLRNVAVGLLKRKTADRDCEHLRFVAYEVVGRAFGTVEEKLRFIINLGFESFTTAVINDADVPSLEEYYKKYLAKYRDAWLFESDGLILQPNVIKISERIEDGHKNHPKWATAWKPPAEEKETELLGIDWRVTRHGTVMPTGVFKPVNIMDVTIQRATLYNMGNVVTMKLNRGDKILVKRSNDVIPQIVSNLTPNKESLLIPDRCPSCGRKLYAVDIHLKCNNDTCEHRQLDKISYWVKKCELDKVSDSTVELLFKAGIVTKIADLYTITEKDLQGVKGLGDSKIANLLNEAAKARSMTAVQLIDRLGIPSVGDTAVRKLGIKTMDDFRAFNDPEYAVGEAIIEWKKDPANLALVDELEKCLHITSAAPLSGKTICFTGEGPESRSKMEARAEKHGYRATKTVSKDLDLLVCDDKSGSSSKLKSAHKHGITIMTYEEFEDFLK